MKIAIMQPYLFPYIGYFQLINAVDKFIIYDDVTYKKQGWINRNNILLNGKPFLFTVPLKDASSYKLIRDIEIGNNFNWKTKLIRTVEQAYKKAPYFKIVIQIFEEVLNTNEKQIAALIFKSLKLICSYIGINTLIIETSTIYSNNYLHSQDRVIDICKQEKAQDYVNMSGGSELYSKHIFNQEHINLSFLEPKSINYKQFNNEFVPWLSIIDIMMFNSITEIMEILNQYELV